MTGYVYNWKDSDITDADTKVKCAGMISEPGGDGYGGTNWSFSVVGGSAQWHIHLNGNAEGRKVNVIRRKSSSTDAGGTNVVKYLDSGAGYPTDRTNLKGLINACGSDYPQFKKLFTALLTELDTFVKAKS